MKKSIQYVLTLTLILTLMLSIGVFAFADGEELPSVQVGFGYGNSDIATIDMHDMTDEDITINGIALEVRSDNGKVFLHMHDLVAAKLLTENKDKADELGLDYSKLYISDGVIFVKTDGLTDEEIADTQAKLDEFRAACSTRLATDDSFELGNAGVTKLTVSVSGFNNGPKIIPSKEEPVDEEIDPPHGDKEIFPSDQSTITQ